MCARKRYDIGDYVEVNGMWGYVQYDDGDLIRVSVDREDGSRETVTYGREDLGDDDNCGYEVDEPGEGMGFLEALTELLAPKEEEDPF